MTTFQYSKLWLAMPMLLLGTGTAHAVANTLTASATAVTITYTLPSTPGAVVPDTFTATSAGTFFSVESATVPGWLTVTQNATAGATVATGATVNFQADAVAGALLPGTYTATVVFQSSASGNPTASVAVTLSVRAAAATFTATPSPSNAILSWSAGAAYPTLPIACTSSGEPISFAVTFGGAISAQMSIDHAGGLPIRGAPRSP